MNAKFKTVLNKIQPFKDLYEKLDNLSYELANANVVNADLSLQLEFQIKQYKELLIDLHGIEHDYKNKNSELNNAIVTLRSELDNKNSVILNMQQEKLNLKKQVDLLKNQLNISEINDDSINSARFWEKHYEENGNSGTGSYNALAQFKADFINLWLNDHHIESVIEFGCGDGNQLSLINYMDYTGIDVAPIIVERNKKKYIEDKSKKFYNRYPKKTYMMQKYQLSLSLDVIFHLLEDAVFEEYMNDLFDSSEKYVIIYSSNHEEYTRWPEFRHRKFMKYIQENIVGFSLVEFVPNKHPHVIGEEDTTTESDFYIFKK